MNYLTEMHRVFPTLTVFSHAKTDDINSSNETNRWPDREMRPHDPPIIDMITPLESVEALKLELGLNDKNIREHVITIVSSPFRCCLETAALIAHALRITSIRVHYGVGDSMLGVRKAGYDCLYGGSLYLSEAEMQEVVTCVADLLTPLLDIDIERVSGIPVPWIEEESSIRMSEALDEIREEFDAEDEHIIVVTHKDVLSAAAKAYGVRFRTILLTCIHMTKQYLLFRDCFVVSLCLHVGFEIYCSI